MNNQQALKPPQVGGSALNDGLGWMPIKTAPKDGTRIRVTLAGLEWVAWWNNNEGSFSYAGGYFLDMPTHWMPCNPVLIDA